MSLLSMAGFFACAFVSCWLRSCSSVSAFSCAIASEVDSVSGAMDELSTAAASPATPVPSALLVDVVSLSVVMSVGVAPASELIEKLLAPPAMLAAPAAMLNAPLTTPPARATAAPERMSLAATFIWSATFRTSITAASVEALRCSLDMLTSNVSSAV